MSKKSGLGKLLVGAAIGAGIGVLFAPKKGSETREDLKKAIDDLAKKVKNMDADEVKDMIEEKIDELKEELADLDKEKVLKIAKAKGKELKQKSEEIVKLAVEKGTPVLQKTAEEVKSSTILVVKEVLKKLEAKEK